MPSRYSDPVKIAAGIVWVVIVTAIIGVLVSVLGRSINPIVAIAVSIVVVVYLFKLYKGRKID